MSDSFLGRWSNRKLQKKAPVEPEIAAAAEEIVHNDSVQNDIVLNSVSAVEIDTASPELDVIPVLPESAATSDNPIAEVVSESAIEPTLSRTGEMDTSSALDVDADNKEPEPLLSDEDMPDIQSLDAGSDLSVFFNRGVSKTLRNAALKHIFGLATYNVRDGLNDYDEDYTVFEPLGDTVTCDMKFHKERKEKLEAERLEQERLEQERLLAEAESDTNEEAEQHDASEESVASNDENDDATQEPDESEPLLASAADEQSNDSNSTAPDATDTNSNVASAVSNEHDSITHLQDKSEHA